MADQVATKILDSRNSGIFSVRVLSESTYTRIFCSLMSAIQLWVAVDLFQNLLPKSCDLFLGLDSKYVFNTWELCQVKKKVF